MVAGGGQQVGRRAFIVQGGQQPGDDLGTVSHQLGACLLALLGVGICEGVEQADEDQIRKRFTHGSSTP